MKNYVENELTVKELKELLDRFPDSMLVTMALDHYKGSVRAVGEHHGNLLLCEYKSEFDSWA